MPKTTTIQIPASTLYQITARVAVAAAKPAERIPVLTHLQVTVSEGSFTVMATDRYRLFMDSAHIEDDQVTGQFLLPAAAVTDFKRHQFANMTEPASVTWSTQEGEPTTITVATSGMSISYTVDHQLDYPAVRSLLTSSLSQVLEGEPARFLAGVTPTFIADFAKVFKIGVDKSSPLSIYPVRGGSQFLCHYRGTNFWGLLMGTRHHDDAQNEATAREAIQAAQATLAAV